MLHSVNQRAQLRFVRSFQPYAIEAIAKHMDCVMLGLQVQPNQLLNTSRYRHQLVNWKGSILAVGGQVDDLNGQSHKVLNILQLDMASRSWSLKREFKSAPNSEWHEPQWGTDSCRAWLVAEACMAVESLRT